MVAAQFLIQHSWLIETKRLLLIRPLLQLLLPPQTLWQAIFPLFKEFTLPVLWTWKGTWRTTGRWLLLRSPKHTKFYTRTYFCTYFLALFLHCIGPGAVKIFNGMSFENPDDNEKLECIINKFEEFTIGEINKTYERYVFNRRNRSPEESIDSCIATLRTLAQTCNFCECLRDTLIRDRILLGVCNP